MLTLSQPIIDAKCEPVNSDWELSYYLNGEQKGETITDTKLVYALKRAGLIEKHHTVAGEYVVDGTPLWLFMTECNLITLINSIEKIY